MNCRSGLGPAADHGRPAVKFARHAAPTVVDDVTPATAPTAALLEKYSWDKSAERLLQILEK